MRDDREPVPQLRVLAMALTAGAVITLGVLTLVARLRGPIAPELSVVAYAAAFLALGAPAVAMGLRTARESARPRDEVDPERRGRLARELVVFALLEGAVVLCGLAVVVTGFYWVAAIALVPIVVMALSIPPGDA